MEKLLEQLSDNIGDNLNDDVLANINEQLELYMNVLKKAFYK